MYLNCHTYYSLNYGTFSEAELLELAKRNGVKALALTDINNTSAAMNFVRLAKKEGIKPIVGIDFRKGNEQQFVGLARNNQGYGELNAFLSGHLHSGKPIGSEAPPFENVHIIHPFEKVLKEERVHFAPYEYIGLSLSELRKLPFSRYRDCRESLVLLQPVSFRNKRDYNVHRLLRAIGLNLLLSKLPESQQGRDTDRMWPILELEDILEDFPHIKKNTQRLLEECSIDFGFGQERVAQNQSTFLGSREEDFQRLRELSEQGLPKRYAHPTKRIKKRMEKELRTIRELDFVSYFLINHDIVSYARARDFPYVGRGSGANSLVAYLIGITDVDPVELDLYFERFINPFRAAPPDFDIDFSTWDRDEIRQYIFKRYGHVALLGTYNTFKYRAAVRELGNVFGLPKEEIDRLSENRHGHGALDELSLLVLKYAAYIQGMPNYIGVHPSGVLILDRPAHCFSATGLPPIGFPTVQFDMIVAEDVGIFKFDILGQRGLAKIKEAISIVEVNQPGAVLRDIKEVEVLKRDPNINRLLAEGRAIGAYYVESPAMRGLMKKLRTHNYLGLVAASSVIRPGVSSSGMKDEYIRMERDPERRKRANPMLLDIMPETHGIMVYQEDVLKVAHLFAGLDLGEADILRRGMSGKFRSQEEFKAVKRKFFENCRARGHDSDLTANIWEQIESFAGYAFAKGHSASYAVESYQSLYLKCYFPLEFMVAVLNNGGGFYDTELYVHEAKMWGGILHPPCINLSDHINVIYDRDIYLGFGTLKNLELPLIKRLLTERQRYGRFRNFDDFIDRVPIAMEQLSILVRIDAFRCFGIPKKEVLWHAVFKTKAQRTLGPQQLLFKPRHKNFKLPQLLSDPIEDAYDQLELLGFPLCGYYDLMLPELKSRLTVKDFPDCLNKKILVYGSMVHTRINTTSKGDRMRFTTMLDLNGDFFDCIHFPQYMHGTPIHGKGIYACYGTVTEEFGHYCLEVESTQKQSLKPDPRQQGQMRLSYA